MGHPTCQCVYSHWRKHQGAPPLAINRALGKPLSSPVLSFILTSPGFPCRLTATFLVPWSPYECTLPSMWYSFEDLDPGSVNYVGDVEFSVVGVGRASQAQSKCRRTLA
ncbi:hypothetical protein AB1N83_011169 [Pleurotus pulmonarius]